MGGKRVPIFTILIIYSLNFCIISRLIHDYTYDIQWSFHTLKSALYLGTCYLIDIISLHIIISTKPYCLRILRYDYTLHNLSERGEFNLVFFY